MKNNGVLRKTAISLAVCGILIASSTSASAATASGSFSATCDPINYGYSSDNLYHYHPNSSSTISVKNNGSDRTATARLYRSTGTGLFAQNLGIGEKKSWSSAVAQGYYRVEAKAASTANCNGPLPGKGNFTFKYEIDF